MLFKYVYDEASKESAQDDSLKRYAGSIDANLDWFGVQEIIEDVESDYISTAIGEDLYEEIKIAYREDNLTQDQTALVRKLQPAIAKFVEFTLISARGITITELGANETISKDGTLVGARQWRTKEALRKTWISANQRLDRSLKFLHTNKDDYPTWTGSLSYTESKGLFFNNAESLAKYMPCEAQRVVYLLLRHHIKEAEIRYIKPVLGEGFFNEIKTSIINDPDTPLTADQNVLIDKVRWALIQWVQKCAIPFLRLRYNQLGLVEPDFDQIEDGRQVAPASEMATKSLWISLIDAANYFTNDLKSYLFQNADKFPTFKASDLYNEDEPPTPFLNTFNEESTGIGSFL